MNSDNDVLFYLGLTTVEDAANPPSPSVVDMHTRNGQPAAFTVPTQRSGDFPTEPEHICAQWASQSREQLRSARTVSTPSHHRIVHHLKQAYRHTRSAVAIRLFDRRYGVRTEERIELDSLGLDDHQRCGYMPYGWRSLARILPPREVSPHDVFLDAGSGMGRVVLQAALHYPFRRVIGVEIAATLHQISESNLSRNSHRLACSNIDLVHSDIMDYDIPDDVTVVFLFNPFSGDIFSTFIRRLLESVDRCPRTVRLIYGNPREESALLATGRARRVRSLPGLRPGREWSRSNTTRQYLITPEPSGKPPGTASSISTGGGRASTAPHEPGRR